MMHLYEEVSRLHFWEGHLEVLDDLDATGLVDTDGFDFRWIGHGITELVEGSNSILQGLDGIAVYPTLFHPTFPHASDLQL
jgi:hypothetical protein